MECQAITGKSNQRGFNLIESAIVLGVVGLVIGGIWVAASAVQNHIKWNQTEDGLLSITARLFKTYDARTAVEHLNSSENSYLGAFMESSVPNPSGWTGSRVTSFAPSTYYKYDPFGERLSVAIVSYGSTTAVLFGYPTLEADHCAHKYPLFYKISETYKKRIAYWDGKPAGCTPSPSMTYTDYINSTCCPGKVLPYFVLSE